MVKKLYKIFKKLISSKISFSLPNYELLIFDGTSLNDLKKHLLKNEKYFILENRYENIKEIYLSPKIIYIFLLNFILNYKNLLIQDIYLITIIQIIKPKVVLTFIDNSIQFSKLSKINKNKNIKFIALQNGSRIQWHEQFFLFKKKLIQNNINLDYFLHHFLCFGEYEMDECENHSIKVVKFTFVGNIRLSNFLKDVELKKILIQKNKYDICLISDHGAWLNKYNGTQINKITQANQGMVKLIKYTIKFSQKNNFRLIFSFKRKPGSPGYEDEQKWLKENFTFEEHRYLKRNSLIHKEYSSYINSFESKVVVANMSTLLRENISCGNKILSCNLTNSYLYDFPIKGICSINNCDFEAFSQRLLNIINIEEKDYFNQLEMKNNYLVHYNEPDKCFNAIRETIYKYL